MINNKMIKFCGIFCLLLVAVSSAPEITANDRGLVDSYGNPIGLNSLTNTIIPAPRINNVNYDQYQLESQQQPQQVAYQQQPQQQVTGYQQQPQQLTAYQQQQQQPHQITTYQQQPQQATTYQQQPQQLTTYQQNQPISTPQYPIQNSVNPSFIPPFVPPEFTDILNQYLANVQQNAASGGTFAYSSPGARAFAYSSLGPRNLYKHHADFSSQQFQHNFANMFPQINAQINQGPSYDTGYSGATGSFTPNGIHQSAFINPLNPNIPNVNTYYATQSDGKPGFYGVATSSFSSSADVNGVKSNQRGAYTTINDNGKITSYKVES